MKIVIVTDAWHPQVNGVVTTLVNTIACLETLGHTVEVIEPSQFRGFSLSLLHGLKLALPPYGLATRLAQADAVHIVTEGLLGLAAKLHCDRRQLPYSTAFHTNYAVYMKENFHLPEWVGFSFLRWFHRNSEAMMVPSVSMIATLHQEGFSNAVHWPRGVDGSVFHKDQEQPSTALLSGYGPGPYWLNVGRVSKEKNIKAFLDLDLPGTKIVVGDGPQLDDLRKTYPGVAFLGPKRGQELGDVYRAADVFVFPSRFDTFGLVIAEAISCGTPVAAFPVTGPIDIIQEGKTGALDEDLRAACERALALPEPDQSFDWMTASEIFFMNLRIVSKDS